jgi:hypothetical protein
VAAPVAEKAPLPVEKGPAKAVPESPVVAKAETIQPAVEKTAPAAIEPAPTKDVPAKPATVSLRQRSEPDLAPPTRWCRPLRSLA